MCLKVFYIYTHVYFLYLKYLQCILLLHIRRDVIRWPAAAGTAQHSNHHAYVHDHNLAGAHDHLSNGHAFFYPPHLPLLLSLARLFFAAAIRRAS